MVDVWVLSSPSQVLVEQIDDYKVCYSRLTGETHILNAFPAEILGLLAAGPRSSTQIGEELAALMGEEPGSRSDKINGVLRDLQHLQLVEWRSL